ncbi:MAG: RagB/SusD family nutrient uptake outer membrane protein [Gemmatimonadaceae bacterium]
MRLHTRSIAALLGCAALSACGNFDISNPNAPSVDNLLQNPSRSQLSAAASGIFLTARGDAQGLVWVLGSMGREGAKLDGNNQPDYQEPFYGPLSPGGIGGAFWTGRYASVRSINTYLQALDKTSALNPAEVAASRGMAKTMKTIAFLTIVGTHGSLGAPVAVDLPINDVSKAPFVSEDSVYGYVIGQLDSAYAELGNGGNTFPFALPSGFAGEVGSVSFATPAAFRKLTRAIKAKALVMRATAGCGANCFTQAFTALGESFLDPQGDLRGGAYWDYSTRSGDAGNGLSDPIGGTTFFALDSVLIAQAQRKPNGALDARLVNKITAAADTQRLGGVPIVGRTKFTVYLAGRTEADPGTPIPLIRNEELILLRAEASLGAGNRAAALADINIVRQGAGGLGPSSLNAGSATGDILTEVLYNRRYSLLWEQGTSWMDARRYGRLANIPALVPDGRVPTQFPIPSQECSSRGLAVPCSPLGGT